MTEYTAQIAMSVRTYGTVSIEAPSFEEARKQATAEYIADYFEVHGSGSDDFDFVHPTDIYVMELEGDDTTEEFTDWNVAPGHWEDPTASNQAAIQDAGVWTLTDRLAQHKADMRAKGWLLPGEDEIPQGVSVRICSPAFLVWVKPICEKEHAP
ncbi:hypothetical protein SAMN04490248_1313 [Salinihabitans flavidus]|uniref:Uncharacterized protein n=1 Tax=Salinihabitans flavidus TaxID=569882 RepID=A0A1H8VM16_9RHOB|nr:hypothetical protein [Salinihabitans flavidus]SEP16441.1 hypothetical protein SAMN04490248_1313 [Salinihabitans flavidus]